MGSVSCFHPSDLTPLPLSSHLRTLVTTLGPPRSSRTISPIQGYLIGTLDATCCLSFPLPGIFTGSGDQDVDMSKGTLFYLPQARHTFS